MGRVMIAATALSLILGCRGSAEPTPLLSPSATAGSPAPAGPGQELPATTTPAPPPATPAPPPKVDAPAPTTLVGSGMPSDPPPADAVGCSISDSNGPLPGGSSEIRGCAADETCICGAQAGYSCSGSCARDGAWVVRAKE